MIKEKATVNFNRRLFRASWKRSLMGSFPIMDFQFLNLAHNYWDNFRLTGEFHVRQAKPPRF
jgi:hypothetical protein